MVSLPEVSGICALFNKELDLPVDLISSLFNAEPLLVGMFLPKNATIRNIFCFKIVFMLQPSFFSCEDRTRRHNMKSRGMFILAPMSYKQ